jgi:hypothetical protein
MDPRLDTDPQALHDEPPAWRRFAPLAEDERDATYPMLAPAAAVTVGHEEDVFDEQILAGLVNV